VDVLKALLASKKFTAMIIGIIATFMSDRFGLPKEQMIQVIGLIISYIIGQGIADHGKEAAKIIEGVEPGDSK